MEGPVIRFANVLNQLLRQQQLHEFLCIGPKLRLVAMQKWAYELNGLLGTTLGKRVNRKSLASLPVKESGYCLHCLLFFFRGMSL